MSGRVVRLEVRLAGEDLVEDEVPGLLAILVEEIDQVVRLVSDLRGAAARLGVKRSTLNYRMKKLGIQPPYARSRALEP